tara:strand:- start:661 stop:1149 length:489 start_codon:yes stop_codon:yes gene_type:complete
MDPADFSPKKDLKGKAKETEAFESWVDDTVNEYSKDPKDPEDKEAKLKAIQDIQMDPNTAKDPEVAKMAIQRKKELMKEPVAAEGNQFAQAVQKAKAAGMKAGDKFKVGDEEYTLKDAIEMAGLQLEEFFSEEEMEVPEEAQAEAEAINTELDRIKTLANIA